MWGKTITSNNIKHSDLDQNMQISRAAGRCLATAGSETAGRSNSPLSPRDTISGGRLFGNGVTHFGGWRLTDPVIFRRE